MNAIELHKVLKNDVAEVTFTKKDGSERKMLCTLSEKFLPIRATDAPVASRDITNNLTVWDLEMDAWRSFRVDSVTDIVVGE